MIVKTMKYLFVGAKEDLDLFFERAQEEGCIEFISPAGRRPVEYPSAIHHLFDAIKILRKLPPAKMASIDEGVEYADRCAEEILRLRDQIERQEEELRIVAAEISRVGVFGDFSKEDVAYIEREGACAIQFYCMKSSKTHGVDLPEEVLYVGTEYDLDYFLALNRTQTRYPGMIEMRIEKPLGALKKQKRLLREGLHESEALLKTYASHLEFLRATLAVQLDHFYLHQAKNQAVYPIEERLFAIEAWIPANKGGEVQAILGQIAVHAEEIQVEEEDRVPTCMQNKKGALIGEDLVKIYDIPSPEDKDPSLWVLSAFTLFFAIIIADGGYGLIFLAIALFLRFKFPHLQGAAKRTLKLFTLLACSCIVWGVLTNAFFGIRIESDNPLARVSILRYLAERKAEFHMEKRDDAYREWVEKIPALGEIKDPALFAENPKVLADFSSNVLLEFSLFLGVIHISLSLLRNLRRSWAGVGWILFLLGGYLYFPFSLHATTMVQFLGMVDTSAAGKFGLQMIYTGLALAVVIALVQKRLKGIGEIANVIQVFADTLSYLRLYALALASTIMAATFNEMGSELGLFLGTIVVVVGHSVNILLGSAGGVIHGLRLNFLEWYHFSFEGGGRLFRPLKKIKTPKGVIQ